MKKHSAGFKKEIKLLGMQQNVQIKYGNTTIDNEQINEVKAFYKGNLLKSIMKGLEIDSNVNIPKGTEINFKYGLLVNGAYEYLDFGKYIVKDIEKQEDTDSYLIKCYDKLLFSMRNYESLGVKYPITVKQYIIALCNKLGFNFKNKNETFVNSEKLIPNELYLDAEGNDIGFKYRDVLDELAETTASAICLNSNDEIELRDITQTNDTIDEEYFNDTNVNIGKKIVLNSIVLSRGDGADNIYRKDELSIRKNGLYELKITDNQIMNQDNRDTFIDEIYNKLNGTEFYLNDFNCTGILYYDFLDRYNVKIGNNTYSCVMFSDEIKINQGLEEHIYTEESEKSETDYSKADKTDRKLNRIDFTVDKHNKQIKGIITDIGDRSKKKVDITAEIDGLHTLVEDIEDLTLIAQGNNPLLLKDCSQGILYELHIYGNNLVFNGPAKSQIKTIGPNKEEKIYNLGITQPLRESQGVYDEYIIKDNNAKVIRRIDPDGSVKPAPVIEDLGDIKILLLEGNNTINILNYTAKMKITYIRKSQFSDVFSPTVDMKAQFDITAQKIDSKVSKNDIGTEIEQNSEAVKLAWNQISQLIQFIAENGNAQLQIKEKDGMLLMTLDKEGQQFYDNNVMFGEMGVSKIDNGEGQIDKYISFSVPIEEGQSIQDGMAWGVKNKQGQFFPIFFIKDFNFPKGGGEATGNLVLNSCSILMYGMGTGISTGTIKMMGDPTLGSLMFLDEKTERNLMTLNLADPVFGTYDSIDIFDKIHMFKNELGSNTFQIGNSNIADDGTALFKGDVHGESLTSNSTIYAEGEIYCTKVNERGYNSRAELKTDIEIFNKSGLDIVDNTDIYEYRLKTDKKDRKKRIGFVIGENYNYTKEITEIDKDNKEIGVNNYSMNSVSFKAIQELHQMVKKQQKTINKLTERISRLEK